MKKITLNQLYDIMYDHLDPNGWWPGRSDWQVIWSTVLIQNTNWKNVDKVLVSLYHATDFLPANILQMSDEELQQVISSAGSYTRKAQTIKNLAQYFKDRFNYDLELAQQQNKQNLRQEILAIKGIGPETADVILMYGLRKGEFVVDQYSRKLFSCLGWPDLPSYEKTKKLIEANLTNFTLRNYQNFHAMIDMFGQKYKLPQQFSASFLKDYRLKDLKTDKYHSKF
ncbi:MULTISPECIES: endonuclease III domain-containing protein [Lactobacillus]|uniref:Endonuclease III n=1 Tax=Lactobacillus xujianguonis TaxID=2495899 RepID=A0A437SYG3_9LACO|nr:MULTISPECIES: endonuclease III [Lactobacillus]RVU71847.1 endonuclease III [Lactobacillus xujianguonis]RVU77623.1 endonuclease III [Lactobacillus xujianguonis]